ncbi:MULTISPECIES: ACP S-malonyltransferase [unclassified Neisseria]|uniref:ACP S-malonyltransferase n=1 Tax=unclassified Neisseria TaxID=2623750 RepID=UPI002665A592|nr:MULTISPECIES: ACP S-malonyltransferase [unclassified Neisseria]MDO1508850.1 ACP S-malonyltransferase [Neisseria sp. MVDL19-042950]MDO1515109.1 ACP S-malonyltransferase [Neisseria sp. MVDL18-041461]MDO1562469.1 ACP S-malonyltransferase [Neisseria sp. MVDL20-010259]
MSETEQKRLLERVHAKPFALCFSGQGFDWISMLREALAEGVREETGKVADAAAKMVAPVAEQLATARPQGFEPIAWADGNSGIDLVRAAVSVPGIFLSQIANLHVLETRGLDIGKAAGVIGHSQGILGRYLVSEPHRAAEILALAELIGAAATQQGRKTGMYMHDGGHAMVIVQGVSRSQLADMVDRLFPAASTDLAARPCIGLRNSQEAFVVSGRPESVQRVCEELSATIKDSDGLTPESLLVPLEVEVGFHHPALAPAVVQVAEWAAACGLDAEQARGIAQNVLVDPVDWVEECRRMADLGVRRILEIGPSGGVAMLTQAVLDGENIEVLDVSGAEGKAALFGA